MSQPTYDKLFSPDYSRLTFVTPDEDDILSDEALLKKYIHCPDCQVMHERDKHGTLVRGRVKDRWWNLFLEREKEVLEQIVPFLQTLGYSVQEGSGWPSIHVRANFARLSENTIFTPKGLISKRKE